jgi:hypothetical protein
LWKYISGGFIMPIVMKLKNDQSYPAVVCDVCNKEIEDATDGNAQWMMGEETQGVGATLYFTHKACYPVFKSVHRKEHLVGGVELSHFMVYLQNNVHLDLKQARKEVRLLASIE